MPLVVCLCAAWCSACRDYRATFDALAAQLGSEAEFAWVDVEDEADTLGDLDIDDFPTLFIADGDDTVFLGPVTPQLQTAERLVRSALAGALVRSGAAEHAGLATRVRTAIASSPDERARRGSPR